MIFIGILDFLGVRGYLLRNSRIPSDFCLGILEFLTRNSKFIIGILEFPTMSSTMSSLGSTRGSLFYDAISRSSWGMTQGLGILEFPKTRIPQSRIPPKTQIKQKNSRF